MEKLTIEKLKMNAIQILTPEFIADIGGVNHKIQVIQDLVSGNLKYELKCLVWAEELQQTSELVEFTFPKTWWDCFKRDVLFKKLPSFIIRWFKRVEYAKTIRVVIFSRYATFPKLTLVYPEMTKDVVIKETIRTILP